MTYAHSETVAPKNYDVYLRVAAGTGALVDGYFSKTEPAWKLDGFIEGAGASLLQYMLSAYDPSSHVSWVRIGVLDAEPTFNIVKGKEVPLNTGNTKTITRKSEIDFTSLSVDDANWDAIVTLVAQGNVDVLFVDTDEVTGATTGNGKGVNDCQLNVDLNLKGNDLDRMPFSVTKEFGNLPASFNFVDVQL